MRQYQSCCLHDLLQSKSCRPPCSAHSKDMHGARLVALLPNSRPDSGCLSSDWTTSIQIQTKVSKGNTALPFSHPLSLHDEHTHKSNLLELSEVLQNEGAADDQFDTYAKSA